MRALFTIAASLAIACSATATPEKPDLQDLDRLVAGLEETPLLILKLGSGAPVSLGFTPEADASARVDMLAHYEMLVDPDAEQAFRQAQLPSVRFVMDYEAQPDDDGGAISTTLTVHDASVVGRADPANPAYAGAAEGARQAIGSTVTVRNSVDGEHLSIEDNGAANIIRALEWVVTTVRFPERDINPGTTWRTLSVSDAIPGIESKTVTDITLDEADSDTYTITFTSRTVGRLTNLNDNQSPIRGILVASEGTVTVDRALAMPVEGDVSTATWMTIKVSANNQAGIVQQAFAQTVELTPNDGAKTDDTAP